jgi:hypothetical protein
MQDPHGITLDGMIAVAAGFQNPSMLATEGLPNKVCLLFLCFGKCGYKDCDSTHPTSAVDNGAATKLYRLLLPGINKLNAQTRSHHLPITTLETGTQA